MRLNDQKCMLASVAVGFVSIVVAGQTPPAPQSQNTRPDTVQRELQRQAEMKMLENALGDKRPRKAQRYPPLVLEQIKADFLGIQVIDRKLIQMTLASEALDLKALLASVAEIRKLSKRLKKNLALPMPEQFDRSNVAVAASMESLRSSLPALSKLIDGFVSNPMFDQVRLIDSQLSARALWDLETIIELSGGIRDCCEKLLRKAKSR